MIFNDKEKEKINDLSLKIGEVLDGEKTVIGIQSIMHVTEAVFASCLDRVESKKDKHDLIKGFESILMHNIERFEDKYGYKSPCRRSQKLVNFSLACAVFCALANLWCVFCR